MTRFRFYVGLKGNTGQNKAHACLIQRFGGYTRMTGNGAWASPGGDTIREQTILYEVLADMPAGAATPAAKATAETLAGLCAQKSVLWTVEDVQGGFT